MEIWNKKPPPRYFSGSPTHRIYHLAHHTRWHTNRGLCMLDCGWCNDNSPPPKISKGRS